MASNFTTLRTREIKKSSLSYAEEMKKIAYVQFKSLAKKHIRLPFEQYHL